MSAPPTACRIDLTDTALRDVRPLIGGPHHGDFALVFDHVSLIVTRDDWRALRDHFQHLPESDHHEP